MATGSRPITSEELRNALTDTLQYYATKADLNGMKADLYRFIAIGVFAGVTTTTSVFVAVMRWLN